MQNLVAASYRVSVWGCPKNFGALTTRNFEIGIVYVPVETRVTMRNFVALDQTVQGRYRRIPKILATLGAAPLARRRGCKGACL